MRRLRTTLQSARQRTQINNAKIAETSRRSLIAAGLNGTGAKAAHIENTIRRALSCAGLMADTVEPPESSTRLEAPELDAQAHTSRCQPDQDTETADPHNRRVQSRFGRNAKMQASHIAARERSGQFLSRSYSNAAGTSRYKLYIPPSYYGKPMPLIVMLHGCTQDPDDFAAGTRMNERAATEGLLVVYPAQSANANGAKCWNWFHPAHQVRDRGEPSLIAGIVHDVAAIYAIDPGRVFVAGLSAGAAMAVVLGATYPDLFAGVGAHSGLPYGAACDLPSALAAMRGSGGQINDGQASKRGASNPRTVSQHKTPPMPTIVFHGDRDGTVNYANGSAIVSRAVTFASESGRALNKTVKERQSGNGGRYTTTIYRDATSRPHVEEWILHGSGHAWSGGSADGSYTDVGGPDASGEMLRFFLAQAPSSG